MRALSQSCALALVILCAGAAAGQPFFIDQTTQAGLAGARAYAADTRGPGAVFADLDNDRYPDIYLIGWDQLNVYHAVATMQVLFNTAYRNEPDPTTSGRKFVQLPLSRGGSIPNFIGEGAVAVDYNNDATSNDRIESSGGYFDKPLAICMPVNGGAVNCQNRGDGR